MTKVDQPQLIAAGPYRYVRHPIYTGFLLAIAGTVFAVDWYWFLVAAISGSYFIYSATKEEEYMSSQYPKDYPAYRKHTKMLLPFLI